MSCRSSYIFIALTSFMIMVATMTLVGCSYLQIAERSISTAMPTPELVATAVTAGQAATEPPPVDTANPMATATPVETPIESAATSVPATATSVPAATALPPTDIVVYATAVDYVMAQTDVDIRSGPGEGYDVVGWVAGGQIAKVTGASGDKEWWRVICPDDSVGSCWVTAHPQYTQPTTPPGTAPTATTVPPTVTKIPTATAVPPTAVVVYATAVDYIMAQTDINIRSGPGTGYGVVGWVAEGQIVKVTGVSGDNEWWRVICPDDSIGSCWVTAHPQYTRPTTAPGKPPTATATATPVPVGCSNSAALIADVTVPDGTQFPPNTGFNKTWRIKNTGTCTWDNRYKLIHHAGSLLGVIASNLPLPGKVAPNQTVDLTVSMISPADAGTYRSDWLLETQNGQLFGVGRSSSPFYVEIVVPGSQTSTISGLVYQDTNQNGVYNSGEVLVGNREVLLFTGPACHVRSQAIASSSSNGNGRYTFSGNYEGSYCVGLAGASGLDDVFNVAIAAGQTMNDINLRAPVPGSSISGFLWDDYCLTDENGDALDGNCVADANGDYHANGMIEPTEGYIAGVTILLQAGPCATDNPVAVSAVTDAAGKYVFSNLQAGTYCVSMNAASPENAPRLLPGDWTFPAQGIWYQQIMLSGSDSAYPVNFGWDYQLK
jgi:uncharacterized protein YgiM (DUF1202 family)